MEKDAASTGAGRRIQVLNELLKTEATYVTSLEAIIFAFKVPLVTRKVITREDSKCLFPEAINALIKTHKHFLEELRDRSGSWESIDSVVGDLFTKVLGAEDTLNVYTLYAAQYLKSTVAFKKLLKQDSFREIHEVLRKENRGLGIDAFLLTPIQRIPRYVLLVKEILKATPELHADHIFLSKAIGEIKTLAANLNVSIHEKDRRASRFNKKSWRAKKTLRLKNLSQKKSKDVTALKALFERPQCVDSSPKNLVIERQEPCTAVATINHATPPLRREALRKKRRSLPMPAYSPAPSLSASVAVSPLRTPSLSARFSRASVHDVSLSASNDKMLSEKQQRELPKPERRGSKTMRPSMREAKGRSMASLASALGLFSQDTNQHPRREATSLRIKKSSTSMRKKQRQLPKRPVIGGPETFCHVQGGKEALLSLSKSPRQTTKTASMLKAAGKIMPSSVSLAASSDHPSFMEEDMDLSFTEVKDTRGRQEREELQTVPPSKQNCAKHAASIREGSEKVSFSQHKSPSYADASRCSGRGEGRQQPQVPTTAGHAIAPMRRRTKEDVAKRRRHRRSAAYQLESHMHIRESAGTGYRGTNTSKQLSSRSPPNQRSRQKRGSGARMRPRSVASGASMDVYVEATTEWEVSQSPTASKTRQDADKRAVRRDSGNGSKTHRASISRNRARSARPLTTLAPGHSRRERAQKERQAHGAIVSPNLDNSSIDVDDVVNWRLATSVADGPPPTDQQRPGSLLFDTSQLQFLSSSMDTAVAGEEQRPRDDDTRHGSVRLQHAECTHSKHVRQGKSTQTHSGRVAEETKGSRAKLQTLSNHMPKTSSV